MCETCTKYKQLDVSRFYTVVPKAGHCQANIESEPFWVLEPWFQNKPPKVVVLVGHDEGVDCPAYECATK